MKHKSLWWRFIPVGLSLAVPGLGFVVLGRTRRFVGWFGVMTLFQVGVLIWARTCVMLFTVCLALSFAAALWMMADSFRIPTGFSSGRILLISVSIVLYYAVSLAVDRWCSSDSISFSRVGGWSMRPTLRGEGDWLHSDMLLVDDAAYVDHTPQRGDIVVFATNAWPGPADHHTLTKRVVGLPNERVSILPPHFCIGGSAVTSPPVFSAIAEARDGYSPYCLGRSKLGGYLVLGTTSDVYVISSNCFFLLGDYSPTSLDSRYYGEVHSTSIIGKVIGIVWPPTRIRNL